MRPICTLFILLYMWLLLTHAWDIFENDFLFFHFLLQNQNCTTNAQPKMKTRSGGAVWWSKREEITIYHHIYLTNNLWSKVFFFLFFFLQLYNIPDTAIDLFFLFFFSSMLHYKCMFWLCNGNAKKYPSDIEKMFIAI